VEENRGLKKGFKHKSKSGGKGRNVWALAAERSGEITFMGCRAEAREESSTGSGDPSPIAGNINETKGKLFERDEEKLTPRSQDRKFRVEKDSWTWPRLERGNLGFQNKFLFKKKKKQCV